jgi:hypothetical protein
MLAVCRPIQRQSGRELKAAVWAGCHLEQRARVDAGLNALNAAAIIGGAAGDR